MRLAVVWLAGSFVLFLLVGEVGRVPDMTKLVIFIAATIGAFVVGYRAKLKLWNPRPGRLQHGSDDVVSARRWIIISAIYTCAFGLVSLQAYGATSPSQVLSALQNPGEAYFYRLREARLEAESGSAQLLTLGAALTTPLVPFALLYWSRITIAVKALVLLAVALYSSYWVFIGTQKGIGDFATYAAISLLALGAMNGRRTSRKVRRIAMVLAILFAAYMVLNQSDRLASQNTTGGIEPNPLVSAIAGEDIGRGVTTTLFYPTHGYLGLAYNLESSFVWTEGRGSSRAVDSYWTQYVGGDSKFFESYPARTQISTGWDALAYWATIYPWLASDLTFPGAVLFMAVVGWWLARWWLEAVYLRRRLSLLLVCQMGILVAYVPANNQIGITRPGLIAFATLLTLYGLSRLNDALGRQKAPRRGVMLGLDRAEPYRSTETSTGRDATW
jgi:hypothetical protein